MLDVMQTMAKIKDRQIQNVLKAVQSTSFFRYALKIVIPMEVNVLMFHSIHSLIF